MKDFNILKLGQGNTPLVRLYNLEKFLQWSGELWVKCEYQNPTGSFKDRGSVEEVKEALKQKKNGVVCASTGNMAASLSAYATKVGLPCYVIVPQKTPVIKLQQALMYGATLIEIPGTYDQCVKTAKKIAKEKNFLLCGDYQIRREGQTSIGKELAQSEITFDGFVCPVGNGTVACAISEGFAKYNQYPKLLGVSGFGADPLVKAFKKKLTRFNPIENPETIASAMNVGNPLDGILTLSWIYKTNGVLLSVTDKEIIVAQKQLATFEGLFVEPAAAATFAALSKLSFRSQNLVLILTGHGLKGGGDMGEFESKPISNAVAKVQKAELTKRQAKLAKK